MTFLVACITSISVFAQTSGTLSVAVTTSSAGGNYAPRNIVAIWVEDSSGNFVKTLLAYAASRKTHLNNWETSTTSAGNVYNVTDAISGATQSAHGTRTCTWNGTDFSGKMVADGNYNLRMELTDKNSTGNSVSFTFIKSTSNQKLTPANVPSFSSVSIEWKNLATEVIHKQTKSNTIVVYPNPGTGIFNIIGEDIKSVQVRDLSGKIILKTKSPVIDLSNQPKGIYLFTIKAKRQTFVEKIVKG